MRPLAAHIRQLRAQVGSLDPAPAGQVERDVLAGRAHIRVALIYIHHAETALADGDEKQANRYLIEAQSALITAMGIQLPDQRRQRLTKRPDVGGRPSHEDLDLLLYTTAENHQGGKAGRCRASIAESDILRAAFGTLSDSGLRKALARGAEELKRELTSEGLFRPVKRVIMGCQDSKGA